MNVKYTKNGGQVNVIQKLEDGRFLVEPFYTEEYYSYEDSDGEYYDHKALPMIVDKVFDEAPVLQVSDRIKNLQEERERLEGDTKNLHEEIRNLKTEKREVEKQVFDAKNNLEDMKDTVAQIDGLSFIKSLSDGRYKYTLWDSYGDLRVLSIAEYYEKLEEEDYYDRRNKDVFRDVFSVSFNRELQPRLEFKSHDASLFETKEAAKAHGEKMLLEKINEEGHNVNEDTLKKFKKLGVEVPDWYLEKYNKIEETEKAEKVDKLKAEIRKLQS